MKRAISAITCLATWTPPDDGSDLPRLKLGMPRFRSSRRLFCSEFEPGRVSLLEIAGPENGRRSLPGDVHVGDSPAFRLIAASRWATKSRNSGRQSG